MARAAIDETLVRRLEEKAREIRIRLLEMIHVSGAGHPGGSLSAADIVTALYFHFMNVDPGNPGWADRDRFILSKGHACPVWYTALALKGFFPESELKTLRKLGSSLQGHPSMKDCPGIDITTGSLGNGLSAGVGMALAGKLDRKDYHVFVVLGDGELDEGVIWEAAMCAAKYRLDNLIAFVDYNHLQLDGTTEEIMPLEPLTEKWRSFNWTVFEIDGHDMEQILRTTTEALGGEERPKVIIANTIKGKGVPYMENQVDWHGLAPNEEELRMAIENLRKTSRNRGNTNNA